MRRRRRGTSLATERKRRPESTAASAVESKIEPSSQRAATTFHDAAAGPRQRTQRAAPAISVAPAEIARVDRSWGSAFGRGGHALARAMIRAGGTPCRIDSLDTQGGTER